MYTLIHMIIHIHSTDSVCMFGLMVDVHMHVTCRHEYINACIHTSTRTRCTSTCCWFCKGKKNNLQGSRQHIENLLLEVWRSGDSTHAVIHRRFLVRSGSRRRRRKDLTSSSDWYWVFWMNPRRISPHIKSFPSPLSHVSVSSGFKTSARETPKNSSKRYSFPYPVQYVLECVVV
jgi:hypothetical protein